jgi:GNAT superfamily N-acetyltransferase
LILPTCAASPPTWVSVWTNATTARGWSARTSTERSDITRSFAASFANELGNGVECGEFTGGKLHPFIPLLAINPTIKSRGYGTSIVCHLIDEAALLALRGLCHDVLFLDVYTTSDKAIRVYTECGFATVSPEPIPDPQEGGKTYSVMAKRISFMT